MPNTAVVILNFNGKSHLQQFLPGVIEFSENCDIYVVDNGSTDGSLNWLNKLDNIHIIDLGINYGFSGGYNKALQQIEAEFYILLNSDVEVTGGWTLPLIQTLENNSQIAACQPKILDFNHRNKFEYAGAAGGFIDMLGYPFCRGRLFSSLEEDNGQFNDNQQIFWASGACLAIKREVFIQAGAFDERFFAHMEEIDLCWRLNALGWKIFYCGQSTVYHLGGGTLSRSNPRKTYLNFRNNLLMLLKNLPVAQISWKLPIRVLLDIIASLFFISRGQFMDFFAVFRAYGSIMGNLSYVAKKRGNLKPTSQKMPIYQGMIVFDFFIKGKRKYRELKFQ